MTLNPFRFGSAVLRRLATRRAAGPPPSPEGAFDAYVEGLPSAQNAVDAVPGWSHAFPPDLGLVAGPGHSYGDPRILWCLEQFGPLAGRSVLELGPLEASHTYILDRQGPAVIHAIEANRLSFLRCLVAKEILDLPRAKFMLGNFVPWLEAEGRHYDLIVASGVLYHMKDPVRLLGLLAARTDAVFLWTHYFDDGAMPLGDQRRIAFDERVETVRLGDMEIRLHHRGYYRAWVNTNFCGGMHDEHFWLERAQILDILRHHGLTDIRIAHDEPAHQNGPSFSVFARRPATAASGATAEAPRPTDVPTLDEAAPTVA